MFQRYDSGIRDVLSFEAAAADTASKMRDDILWFQKNDFSYKSNYNGWEVNKKFTDEPPSRELTLSNSTLENRDEKNK
jgi:hypothetical protein